LIAIVLKIGHVGVLATILILVVSVPSAFAAVGDVVATTTMPTTSFCSIGIAVDNQATPRGYIDECFIGLIQQVNLITGASLDSRNFAAEIPELPNAMAFDSSRGGNWICTQNAQTTPVFGMPIYFQDFQGSFNSLADDTVSQEFLITVPPAGDFSFNFCDGLAINLNGAGAADDRLYFSDDINDLTEIYDVFGTHIATINNVPIDASLSSGSGLAVGGSFLYLANDGGGDVFRADLGANANQPPFVDMFTSGDDRQEDMECDPLTFAPIEVMWVRTTPQGGAFPNVITAYEIAAQTCGVGGEPPIIPPPRVTAVGGEFIPIDATAVLIAGAQTNALSILSAFVVIGAIAFGTLYISVKRKRN